MILRRRTFGQRQVVWDLRYPSRLEERQRGGSVAWLLGSILLGILLGGWFFWM